MSPNQEWENIFKGNAFVNQYQTGERVTGTFARPLIEQSRLIDYTKSNPDKPLVVLDNACGTGVVSSILHHELDDSVKRNWRLTCGDISEGMLEWTRHRMQEEDWQNAETKTVDMLKTGLPNAHFTHVFTAFAYMTLPDSSAAFDETTRILQPGGTIAFSTWIEPGWLSIVKKAVETIPGNLPFPTHQEFLSVMRNGEWHSVSWIESQLKQRGFEDINVQADFKKISLRVTQLVDMTMVMFPMVAKFFWSEKQREEDQSKVRPALTKYLEDIYGKDGDVPMDWTAILSTARKPY
ncbi:hypothetical protein NUU61_002946 [Penicillium alfredii]|uniref:Methyltransferase domain-containing protein n=1 Tax=Penicillium alfredii TaxID=1506179 RepID=A0A9W9KGE6_9EURO|nr:uncharacterized protein NUU61_002946 [Penicillium alfredii]KAJ5105599.1 hypothetical protein NUU61_002946 [Penicillium alfredii]